MNLFGLASTGITAAADNFGITADGFISDISSVSISQFTHVIEKVADARAENGAEQQAYPTVL